MGNNTTNEKIVRRYSEALKRQVVEEIESGRLRVKEAMEYYDIPWQRTINRWQHQYGNPQRGTKIVRVIMKDEKERIRELEKIVADLEIQNRVKSATLEVWEEEYGEDIKKKLSTEELKRFEELRRKAKSL